MAKSSIWMRSWRGSNWVDGIFGGLGLQPLTAHVVYDQTYSPEEALMPALETVLANRFKVVHTTLQCETKPCAHQPEACTTVSGTSEHDDKPNFH